MNQIHNLPPLPTNHRYLTVGESLEPGDFYYSMFEEKWCESYTAGELKPHLFYCRLLPTPTIAPNRNINRLTVDQVECAQGWRLITDAEFAIQYANQTTPAPLDGLLEGWVNGRWSNSADCGADSDIDYRTRITPAEDYCTPIAPMPTAQPNYGDMTGWRFLEVGETIPEGAEVWKYGDGPWVKSKTVSKVVDASHAPFRIPIERPLLTPTDFIKDGPWWLKTPHKEHYLSVVECGKEHVWTSNGDSGITYETLRQYKWQRSRDGINWEDC